MATSRAVGPLADDEKVQEALTDRLEQYAADVVGLDQLGQAQQQAARLAIRTAVSSVVTNSSFRPVWEAANREGHAEMLRTLRDDRAGEIRPLDLAVVVDAVLDAMRAQGLPMQRRGATRPGLHPRPRAAARGPGGLPGCSTPPASGCPVLWVVLVVITLLVAQRRLRALAILAGASLVSDGAALAGARGGAVRGARLGAGGRSRPRRRGLGRGDRQPRAKRAGGGRSSRWRASLSSRPSRPQLLRGRLSLVGKESSAETPV